MALRLRQVLEPQGPATALVLTPEQVEELGGGTRAAVVVTIGERSARLRVASMGGCHLIGLSKSARADLGVQIGDEVVATVELDTAQRVVDVPDDLADALAAAGVRSAFDRLSYTKRKEAARSVGGAKRPETRARRIEAIIAGLT